MSKPADRQRVPITTETVVDMAPQRVLGPVLIDLPEGAAMCHDAISLTTLTACDDGDGEHFVVVISAAEHFGRNVGSMMPMTPEQARVFAKSVIDSAEKVEAANAARPVTDKDIPY